MEATATLNNRNKVEEKELKDADGNKIQFSIEENIFLFWNV